MKTAEEYNKWYQDFFKRYQEIFDPGGANTFPDGIVSFDEYAKAFPKVLFINREAYDEEGGYDVCEAIRQKGYSHWKHSKIGARVAEYLCIADLVNRKSKEEILAMTGDDLEAYYKSCDQAHKDRLLQSCAYINIKKSNGNSTSAKGDLFVNLEKGLDLIVEQIDTITPDIIFGGNVVEGLMEYFEPTIKWDVLYNRPGIVVNHCFIKDKRYLFFDLFHPSARSVNCEGGISNYYKWVFEGYKAALKAGL